MAGVFLQNITIRYGTRKIVLDFLPGVQARNLLKHYPMDIDMRIVGDNPTFAIWDEYNE